ncbi:MAG: GNAT family N-acetyltransferase [Actinomycetota bacterium]
MLQILNSPHIPTDVLDFLNRKPEAHSFLASRLHALHERSRSEALIYRSQFGVEGVTYIGANLLPSFASRGGAFATADYLKSRALPFSSIVGEGESVFALWELIKFLLPRARLIREHQPLLSISSEPLIPSDPKVRLATRDDLELVISAGIEMFIGEVGEPPNLADFRARAIELIAEGRTFIRREGDEILFKADIGAIGAGALQIHGVWVPVAYRGRGFGSHGMASVIRLSNKFAPRACLYVNDFNLAARVSYKKVGFVEVGEFASIFL